MYFRDFQVEVRDESGFSAHVDYDVLAVDYRRQIVPGTRAGVMKTMILIPDNDAKLRWVSEDHINYAGLTR
jgi:hypothetical protein